MAYNDNIHCTVLFEKALNPFFSYRDLKMRQNIA